NTLQEEYPVTANFQAGQNTATVSWTTATPPPLKRGTWILDADMTQNIHGIFYRVVNVIPTGPNSATIELHTNATLSATGAPSRPPNAIIMDTVVEVFQKGP